MDIFNLVKNPNVLCVHIRSGDLNLLDKNFVNIIYEFSKKYEFVILFSGIHSDEHFKNNDTKIENFLNDLNYVLYSNKNIYLHLDIPDVHLSLMSVASNLLLHRGGFSALGSILCTGNLFITHRFNHAFSKNWIDKVNKPYTII